MKENYQPLPAANPSDERFILGAAMLQERAVAILLTTCTKDWFSDHDCKAVFQAIQELFVEQVPWNEETWRLVSARLDQKKYHLKGYADNQSSLVIDYCEGAHYGVSRIRQYIKWLLEPTYIKRRLIMFGGDVNTIRETSDDPIPEVITLAQALLISTEPDRGEDLISRQERMARGEDVGVKTMMPEVDRELGLWRNGHFILLGADSSMGKTAFAGDLCRKLALRGIHIGFASLEMNHEEMTERWISGHASHIHNLEIPYMAFNTGSRMIRDNIDRIKEIKADFDNLPMWFVYDSNFKVNEIKAHFTKFHAKYPKAQWMFVIDYVQLIHSTERKNSTREQELANISKNIKGMAKQLNAPILVLSQFNRSRDYRDDGKPTEFSFRDTGALYNDADKAIALFAKEKKTPERNLMILKNRGGISGVDIFMHYSPPTGRFWTPQEDIPEPGWKQDELPQPKPVDTKILDGNMPDQAELPF